MIEILVIALLLLGQEKNVRVLCRLKSVSCPPTSATYMTHISYNNQRKVPSGEGTKARNK
jgi:hypothetical protein